MLRCDLSLRDVKGLGKMGVVANAMAAALLAKLWNKIKEKHKEKKQKKE